MNVKKLLALLLALVMVFSIAACSSNNGTTGGVVDPTGDGGNGGNGGNGGDAVKATYTYNSATSVFPTNWNAFTYETATDADILEYTSDSLYVFDYNDTMDGYQFVDGMAVGDPVDVTADYVGQYGIVEGDSAKAWKITIRQDLKWETGESITTYDFIESAKRLLDPNAFNYRADSMYNGSFSVYNTENYLKQGPGWFDATTIYEEYSEELDDQLIFSLDGTTGTIHNGLAIRGSAYGPTALIGWYSSYFNSNDAEGVAEFLIKYMIGSDTAFTAEIAAEMEGKTLAEIKADEEMNAAWEALIGWWKTEPNEELHFLLAQGENEAVDWSEVGYFALNDYEMVFILNKSLSGFYLKYSMYAPLVHLATYDACANTDEDGIYTNNYGTSVETTVSYGPYKLTTFIADKQYVLEKNEYYYGLTDDTYQTTHIQVDYVKEAATRLEMFNMGQLDSYGLQKEDMETYQLSDYTYYYTGDSTYAICLNPNYTALKEQQELAGENINKTILTVLEFRQALSFALNRSAFNLAVLPTGNAAFGLYSNLIVSDPENGTAYRTTEQAKWVLAEFWGVADEIGEGKMYADLDEAVESITGYNLTLAKQKFNEAYDIAIEQGLMDEDDVIQIDIGIPSSSYSAYANGYEFLVNCYTEAVQGTSLEGKLTFVMTDNLGNNFANALKTNDVDMLFLVGWTGAALDPYGLMEAYVSSEYQYDASVDFSQINATVEINGKEYTTDCWTWYQIMNGDVCELTDADGNVIEYSCGSSDNDPESRLNILAALEGVVLQNYNFIPTTDSSSAILKGKQIQYKTEEYIFGMGFGGVKYYTYNYSDAEWEAYVEAAGGTLDYT